MKKLLTLSLSILLVSVLFTACKKTKEEKILSTQEMEDVLYDYHLAKSMINYSENTHKEQRKARAFDYIFKKYNINQAIMDSSLAYYSRHAVEFTSIFKRIQDRLKIKKDSVTRTITLRDNRLSHSVSGDTVDLWYQSPIILLASTLHRQHLSFEIKKDSTYHIGDSIAWSFNTNFLATKDSLNRAIAGLRISYKNDSIRYTEKEIVSSKAYQLTAFSNENWEIGKIDGFVYYDYTDSLSTNGLLVNSVKLMRFHRNIKVEKKTEQKVRTIETSSIKQSSKKTVKKEKNTPPVQKVVRPDLNKLRNKGRKKENTLTPNANKR
jgi:hypothetical protein